MSIYASIPGLGADDDDRAVGRPWRYLGSHVLPDEDDPRGGTVGLALIPGHITRDGRDDRPGYAAPWPWLRLHLADCGDDPAVVLNPEQVLHLARTLGEWAVSTGAGGAALGIPAGNGTPADEGAAVRRQGSAGSPPALL